MGARGCPGDSVEPRQDGALLFGLEVIAEASGAVAGQTGEYAIGRLHQSGIGGQALVPEVRIL